MLASIIVPVFMEEWATLQGCVASVLDQTLRNWELLLVSDDGRDYARRFPDPRIRGLSSGGVQRGPSAARNAGMDAARGDFIAFLDADDAFLPRKLEVLIPLAAQYGMALDNCRVVLDDGARHDSTLGDLRDGFHGLDFFAQAPGPVAPVFRRDVLNGHRYVESLRFSEDSLFNYRAMLANGGAYWHASPLHEYRIRGGSLSHQGDSAGVARSAYAYILQLVATDDALSEKHKLQLRDIYRGKMALNEAFASWVSVSGGRGTFQDFIAQRVDTLAAGQQAGGQPPAQSQRSA